MISAFRLRLHEHANREYIRKIFFLYSSLCRWLKPMLQNLAWHCSSIWGLQSNNIILYFEAFKKEHACKLFLGGEDNSNYLPWAEKRRKKTRIYSEYFLFLCQCRRTHIYNSPFVVWDPKNDYPTINAYPVTATSQDIRESYFAYVGLFTQICVCDLWVKC